MEFYQLYINNTRVKQSSELIDLLVFMKTNNKIPIHLYNNDEQNQIDIYMEEFIEQGSLELHAVKTNLYSHSLSTDDLQIVYDGFIQQQQQQQQQKHHQYHQYHQCY